MDKYKKMQNLQKQKCKRKPNTKNAKLAEINARKSQMQKKCKNYRYKWKKKRPGKAATLPGAESESFL